MAAISIIGNGYVGLVIAAGFASKGHNIVCIDANETKTKQINEGKSPIYEAGLNSLLSSCVNEKVNLKASSDYNEILESDVTFICVNTPPRPFQKIDISHIIDSAIEIGHVLARKSNYHVVAVKSTVIPGTTEGIIAPTLERYSSKKAGRDFGISVNPEFLQEGRAIHSFLNPDRIIIGEYDRRAGDLLEELYHDYSAPIIRTNMRAAEMIKYASNAFLATKISFINEIGNICKKLGIDICEVAKGMGYDPRIGNQFLDAGIGFGGSCLPKDLEALIFKAGELGYKAELLQSVSKVNKEQPLRLVEIAKTRLGTLENKEVTVLGLAFKPNTDDIRQAPALKITAQLLVEGATVRVYDPKAMTGAKQVLPDGVEFCDSAPDAIAGSDAVLIASEWDEFTDESLYAGKLVIDGRRVLDPQKVNAICDYQGICW
ncbi:UDP-glucose dehydrogenase family protein [Chloroflexota bacterium]